LGRDSRVWSRQPRRVCFCAQEKLFPKPQLIASGIWLHKDSVLCRHYEAHKWISCAIFFSFGVTLLSFVALGSNGNHYLV
jgi:hypothetical protein